MIFTQWNKSNTFILCCVMQPNIARHLNYRPPPLIMRRTLNISTPGCMKLALVHLHPLMQDSCNLSMINLPFNLTADVLSHPETETDAHLTAPIVRCKEADFSTRYFCPRSLLAENRAGQLEARIYFQEVKKILLLATSHCKLIPCNL